MNMKGLGRGLDSLFGDYEEYDAAPKKEVKNEDKEVKSKPQVVEKVVEKVITKEVNKGAEEISITLIDRNPNQPRKNFDEKALKELAQSIKTHGVIQPIIVVKNGERYTIIAGERRFRASQMAGLKTLPCIVKEYTEKEISEISIIENLQREDLNPIESARAIKELMDKFGLTQETVADRIGKSRPAVANTLRLLTLSPTVIKMVEENKLSAGHARCLTVLEDYGAQDEVAAKAISSKMSVRDLEKYLKLLEKNKAGKKIKPVQSAELKDFAKKMERVFSTKVNILGTDYKGRIFIDYYSVDDLQRIYGLIDKLD